MQSFLLRRLRLVGGERDADLPFALSETSIPLGGLLFDLSCPWCAFGDVGDVLALADNPTNNAYLLNVCRWFTCLPVFLYPLLQHFTGNGEGLSNWQALFLLCFLDFCIAPCRSRTSNILIKTS
jgi:hypothetical protein